MIRIMSFNIRTASASDGPNGWKQRKSLVLERIRVFEPDLLGLQECRDDDQAAFLKENLPEYGFSGLPRGGGDGTALEMAPIFYRQASFQVQKTGCFWLSETPLLSGSKGWDAHFARTACWLLARHLPSGRDLVFLNTHFDYQPQAITSSAALLRRWLLDTFPQTPLILTGDFNASKVSEAYRLLTAGGLLQDALCTAGCPDDLPTFHAFGQPDAEMAIDWILATRHFRVLSAGVDQARPGGRFPSDHDPLRAELAFSE